MSSRIEFEPISSDAAIIVTAPAWFAGMIEQFYHVFVITCKQIQDLTTVRDMTGFFRFDELCRQAAGCRRCCEMAHRSAVLGPGNGIIGARLMFIAEAPGRFGADRTGVPLWGDRTGEKFQHLLEQADLRRDRCFITNAVLCNPRDGRDRNRAPRRNEIRNCTMFLKRQIELVNPETVVTLGAVALSALNLIEGHNLDLSSSAGGKTSWFGRNLIPLYHPSPRTLGRRTLAQQEKDFRIIAKTAGRDGRN